MTTAESIFSLCTLDYTVAWVAMLLYGVAAFSAFKILFTVPLTTRARWAAIWLSGPASLIVIFIYPSYMASPGFVEVGCQANFYWGSVHVLHGLAAIWYHTDILLRHRHDSKKSTL